MFVEYPWTVYVGGCSVDEIIPTVKVDLLEYRIGDPLLTDGYYEFTQSPQCNYP